MAGGSRDADVAGQGGERSVLPEPAQHENRVVEGSQGAAAASPSFTAVDLQQSGEVLGERLRHVERGRIGDHLEPLVRGLGLRKSRPTRGSASLRDSNPALPSQDQLAEKTSFYRPHSHISPEKVFAFIHKRTGGRDRE